MIWWVGSRSLSMHELWSPSAQHALSQAAEWGLSCAPHSDLAVSLSLGRKLIVEKILEVALTFSTNLLYLL